MIDAAAPVSLDRPARDRSAARSRTALLVLAAILLAALALRLWGLPHDLPFSYYGDELHFMKRSMAMGTGDLNPHWFHKPAFLMYVLAFVYGLYYAAGALAGRFESTAEFGAHFLFEPQNFLILGRLVVLACGMVTVWAVHRIGRKAYGSEAAGLAAALVAAVLAPMVASSQQIKGDVPCAMLMTLSVLAYLGVRETAGLRPLRPLVTASLLAGAAMGTHYYGVVLVPAYVGMELLRGFRPEARWRTAILRAALVAVLFVAGFFVTSPYNFLDPTWPRGTLLSLERSFGLTEERVTRYDPDSRVEFEPGAGSTAGAAVAFFELLVRPRVLGWPLTLLAALGLAVTLARRATRWYGLLVLVPSGAFFLAAITVAAYHAQPRHLNAIYPLLATLAWPGALALVEALQALRLPPRRRAAAALALVAAAVLPSLLASARYNQRITRLDSRLAAYRWLVAGIPRGDRLLVDEYGPILNPDRRAAERLAARLATLPESPFTHHQGLRVELLRRYPPADGLNLDELGHQWWLPREKTDEQIRGNPADLDMSSPLVDRVPRTLAAYRAAGIRWVVTNDEAQKRYRKEGDAFPSFARFYRELERLDPVQTFDPAAWDGKGPVVWVYDLERGTAAGNRRPS